MSALANTILQIAHALPEGNLLSPKDFLNLGLRAAVDQTLARLIKQGKLLRISRGVYSAPVTGRFGERPPTPEKVVASFAEQRGETVVPHGAAAANWLGLTTQVPVKEVFLTSGPSRTLHVGTRNIELKHAPNWQLALGKRPAGMAVRALSWLGPEHARQALEQLQGKLSGDEWRALAASRAILPAWMAKAVSETMAHG